MKELPFSSPGRCALPPRRRSAMVEWASWGRRATRKYGWWSTSIRTRKRAHEGGLMKARFLFLLMVAPLPALTVFAGDEPAPPPKIKIPEPGVPQILTMEWRFIRVAYNNEGYAILGYRVANLSVGEKWMLLEVGLTLRDGVPDYTLTREAISLETPDGQTIPMASIEEYRPAPLGGLENRARIQRDSINYFPPHARSACRIGFFARLDSPGRGHHQVRRKLQRG